jgi:hypoxanthine phosphoribosyltransferase
MDDKFKLYLSKEEIEKIVKDISQKISTDYKDKKLVMIGVLKGSFIFLADLIRNLTIPVQVDFVHVGSYGTSTSSSGKVRLFKGIECEIKGKEVLIIEDIIDSGLTLSFLIEYVQSMQPASLKTCALLEREGNSIKNNRCVDYSGRVISKKSFLIGYGLDLAEDYRNIPDIYYLDNAGEE